MGRAIITRQLAEQQSLLRELEDDVTVAVLVAGLGAIALGGALVAARATFVVGLVVQATGTVAVASAGFWVLAAGDVFRAPFTSAFGPSVSVDGLSGLFLGTLRLVAAPALVFSSRYVGRLRRAARRRAHRGVPARACRCSLRTRPAHVPHGWG